MEDWCLRCVAELPDTPAPAPAWPALQHYCLDRFIQVYLPIITSLGTYLVLGALWHCWCDAWIVICVSLLSLRANEGGAGILCTKLRTVQ